MRALFPLLALTLTAIGTHADACDLPAIGTGRVAAIIDGRTLRLDDDRDIRLTGIELPADLTDRRRASDALAALVLGKTVTLQADADAPDRYGRQHAIARDEGGRSLQVQLLSRGTVLASPLAPASCMIDLRAAEAGARAARTGIWAFRTAIKNAETPGDILATIGNFAVIEGRVRTVREAGGLVYVNFGRRWIDDFALIASKPAVTAFADISMPLKSFEKRNVRVRGWITRRTGPRIELFRVEQIEMLGDNEGGSELGRSSGR